METPSAVQRLKHLAAHISDDQQLIIETTEPKTAWVIDTLPGKVTITTTDFHGLLTGWAASSPDRTISILLDPQGEPVKWEGTDEVVNGWGGSLTINQSYLPRRHPEAMHLGLGRVPGAEESAPDTASLAVSQKPKRPTPKWAKIPTRPKQQSPLP